MTLVEIEWHDSERVSLGWDTREAYVEALNDRTTYRTVGFLVDETADHLMVALSASDSGLFGDAMVIPTALIIARHALGRV
jgi:hypothetical protein